MAALTFPFTLAFPRSFLSYTITFPTLHLVRITTAGLISRLPCKARFSPPFFLWLLPWPPTQSSTRKGIERELAGLGGYFRYRYFMEALTHAWLVKGTSHRLLAPPTLLWPACSRNRHFHLPCTQCPGIPASYTTGRCDFLVSGTTILNLPNATAT